MDSGCPVHDRPVGQAAPTPPSISRLTGGCPHPLGAEAGARGFRPVPERPQGQERGWGINWPSPSGQMLTALRVWARTGHTPALCALVPTLRPTLDHARASQTVVSGSLCLHWGLQNTGSPDPAAL